ncbi:hypothetical protein LEP1GSC059_1607 [Leptospira noguchii serovar Panama str. CZ214]|uniref:Uncharacterized protein n=1 Tax=Leptospira noguchii serovar Panama str. CZ214 TaxID=1001595 RepID=T0FUM7_9LEPT|nr:hypothetical protein LEP1GSC059_1607 [Leptospira noguchii serovar Panama str. CZ214]
MSMLKIGIQKAVALSFFIAKISYVKLTLAQSPNCGYIPKFLITDNYFLIFRNKSKI